MSLDICIYGAGAIGGSLAARLALRGANVCVVARGEHGKAIEANGLKLITGSVERTVPISCFKSPTNIPPQDVVVVAVKAVALTEIAPQLSALLKPNGLIVFAMNGILWWFDHGMPVQLPNWMRDELDPGGILLKNIAPNRIVGCVVQSSNEILAPGVILNSTPHRNNLILGKVDGQSNALLDQFVDQLRTAQYQVHISSHIRDDIWIKNLFASSAGPVSALTGSALDQLVAEKQTRAVMSTIMQEGTNIGRALGLDVNEDIEARLNFYLDKSVRPSMLQDFEAGRPAEVESSIVAFAAFATALGMPCPVTQTVAALLRLKKIQLTSTAPTAR